MARITEPTQKHRRDVWLQMVLPIVGVGLVLTLLIVGLFTLAVAGTLSAQQIETMASVMMIVCILLPMALVMMLLNALMVIIAVGTGKIPAAMRPMLESVRIQVEKIARTVSTVTTRFAQPFITLDTRWTRWEELVNSFFGGSDTKSRSKETPKHE